ncbi:hypothetical protein EXE43_21035 [Halorubrum sp. SS5]|nr:hypothetical protein EXE43_21035 [Halorubrum sp. SS5]
MAKRRSMVIGLGALATGSGAVFSSAALQSTTTSDAAFEVYTVQELNVKRGDSTHDRTDNSITDAGDLPQADVDGSTQKGNLNVKVATRNNSDSHSLTHLLDVENNGTEAVNVGFGFETFGGMVVSSGAGTGEVTEDQVKGMYSFQVNTGDSSNTISGGDGADLSPGSGDSKDNPQNYKTIDPGERLAVDLVVDAPGEVVSAINEATNPTGNPFDKESRDVKTLVEKIVVGTENDLTASN